MAARTYAYAPMHMHLCICTYGGRTYAHAPMVARTYAYAPMAAHTYVLPGSIREGPSLASLHTGDPHVPADVQAFD